MDERTFTLVLLALGWGAGICGFLFLRAAWRYDKTTEEVGRHKLEIDRTISAIHRIEDSLGIRRTSIRDSIRD